LGLWIAEIRDSAFSRAGLRIDSLSFLGTSLLNTLSKFGLDVRPMLRRLRARLLRAVELELRHHVAQLRLKNLQQRVEQRANDWTTYAAVPAIGENS
jgi:hypothetical protein